MIKHSALHKVEEVIRGIMYASIFSRLEFPQGADSLALRANFQIVALSEEVRSSRHPLGGFPFPSIFGRSNGVLVVEVFNMRG